MEKEIKIKKASELVLLYLIIDDILNNTNNLELFLEIFVYKNEIDKTKAELEFFQTNYYRWLKKMKQIIRILEENYEEVEITYHKSLILSIPKQ